MPRQVLCFIWLESLLSLSWATLITSAIASTLAIKEETKIVAGPNYVQGNFPTPEKFRCSV